MIVRVQCPRYIQLQCAYERARPVPVVVCFKSSIRAYLQEPVQCCNYFLSEPACKNERPTCDSSMQCVSSCFFCRYCSCSEYITRDGAARSASHWPHHCLCPRLRCRHYGRDVVLVVIPLILCLFHLCHMSLSWDGTDVRHRRRSETGQRKKCRHREGETAPKNKLPFLMREGFRWIQSYFHRK